MDAQKIMSEIIRKYRLKMEEGKFAGIFWQLLESHQWGGISRVCAKQIQITPSQ